MSPPLAYPMKTIKVFIASSEELEFERDKFSDLVLQLNRILKARNIEIQPEKWEWLDDSMGPLHKQEEYNHVLKTCEMCLVLYWTRFGEYTKSELDTAYTELCAGRKPYKLYVYFKDSDAITPELQTFKDSFSTDYGHFFCRFENVDTLRLRFLLQFERYLNDHNDPVELVKVRDSKIEVDGKCFADLHQIPFAGNNPAYLELLKDIEKAQARVLKYPDDMDLRQELHDKKEKLQLMEQSLLETAKRITEMSTKIASARFAEATQLFEHGDIHGANAILNLKEITVELEANVKRFDTAREVVEEIRRTIQVHIDECLLKIDILMSEMKEGWFDEATSIYDQIIRSGRNRIEDAKFAELLRKYANFLRENKQYHLIGNLYTESLETFRRLSQNDAAYESDVAQSLNNLANLHYDIHDYSSAETEHREALEIRRRLAAVNSQTYESDLAETLNNLANLHSVIRDFFSAEMEYKEALEICRRLAEVNPQIYEPDVAMTLYNWATLYLDIRKSSSAEANFKGALEIYRRLAEVNPQIYESNVAETLNGLACLHRDIYEFSSAEMEYKEALEIHRRLAAVNPQAYELHVAHILNNLANLHYDIHDFSSAEIEYREALEIHRRLAEVNLQAYESDVAVSLNNLAGLHSVIRDLFSAETEYQESLEIRRRLAEVNPQAYEPDVAQSLYNLANLHSDIHDFSFAEREYREALEMYRRLAEVNPQAYESDVESTLKNLELVRQKIRELDSDEEEPDFSAWWSMTQ